MEKIYVNDQRKVWCWTCGGLSNYNPKFKKHMINDRETNACCKRCDIEYRLYKGVDRTQLGCHEFQGATRAGYGAIRVNGKLESAHRVSFQLSHGKLESTHEIVRHTCDNTLCININHLIIGDRRENVQDAIQRGRHHFPPINKKAE